MRIYDKGYCTVAACLLQCLIFHSVVCSVSTQPARGQLRGGAPSAADIGQGLRRVAPPEQQSDSLVRQEQRARPPGRRHIFSILL